jgi:hypothetical protein
MDMQYKPLRCFVSSCLSFARYRSRGSVGAALCQHPPVSPLASPLSFGIADSPLLSNRSRNSKLRPASLASSWLRDSRYSRNHPQSQLVVMGLPAYKLKGLNKSGNGVINNTDPTDFGFLSPIWEKHAPLQGRMTSCCIGRHSRDPIHLNHSC